MDESFVSMRSVAAGMVTRVELTAELTKLLREKVQKDVRTNIDVKYIGKYRDKEAMDKIRIEVRRTIEREQPGLTEIDKRALQEQFTNEISGYGVLEPLLNDPEITEILGMAHNRIAVEKDGKLELTDLKFEDEESFRLVIEKILLPIGRSLSFLDCAIDARLPDGSRVNVVGRPIDPNGAEISIRKFKKGVSLEKLVEWGAMNSDTAELLRQMVLARFNVFISGGTGSGKTTLLNAMGEIIPPDQAVITIENPIETAFEHPMVRRWEAKPPNLEGMGQITMRALVFNSLRARPDRIIVGECRGPEAYDMCTAMSTGHPGSLTTGHADYEQQGMERIISMINSAGVLAPSMVPGYVAGAINVVVQVSRLKDKSRKVIGISEVVGADNNNVLLNKTHAYSEKTGSWELVNTFQQRSRFEEAGIDPGTLWIK